ncbi:MULTISPECIES: FAD binding domain-containing protein [unclassified Aureimonas]|uniref:FAD binding domain-containing protein n=1 Tax=unclassified Aureimonas TaxID=2615206 RepID=UPI0006F3BC0F|nr:MULTISPECIES: xanthine dehydrogenase family protein subunit M [unclassified Aureimonas]KQT69716.1 carbon monoxide dehydrogenase [Aureimonas sp. Leaf427]KQT76132.1 carbon monoxide dehydrogenase [Aureimonas sp. Leaf460]
MYETQYHRPTSLAEAASLLSGGADAKYLGGGMTLIPTMKQRLAAPSDLVDLRHVAELKTGIEVSGRSVKIGGGTTHAEIAAHKGMEAIAPGFHYLASVIGDPAVRHMGTIGGSVANFDPAADYPAALLALSATVHTDKGSYSADEFFLGMFETALGDGEIVTGVSFEAPDASGYEKFRNPASRYAMCAVFAARRGGEARIGVTGAGQGGAYRWTEAEAALSSSFDAAALDGLSVPEDNMLSDLHGSASYRANLVKVVTKRAVKKAIGQG